jgi:hypothetical protein
MAISLVVQGSLRLIIMLASGNQRHQSSKLQAGAGKTELQAPSIDMKDFK